MKRTLVVLTMLCAVLPGMLAFAGLAGSPRAAASADLRVSTALSRLQEHGFVVDAVTENPYLYFQVPTPPYVWGTIVYVLRPSGVRARSAQRLTVAVEAKIMAERDGYDVVAVETTGGAPLATPVDR